MDEPGDGVRTVAEGRARAERLRRRGQRSFTELVREAVMTSVRGNVVPDTRTMRTVIYGIIVRRGRLVMNADTTRAWDEGIVRSEVRGDAGARACHEIVGVDGMVREIL